MMLFRIESKDVLEDFVMFESAIEGLMAASNTSFECFQFRWVSIVGDGKQSDFVGFTCLVPPVGNHKFAGWQLQHFSFHVETPLCQISDITCFDWPMDIDTL